MPCLPPLHVFRGFSLKRFLGVLMMVLLWVPLVHADEDTRWKKIEVVPSSVALVGRDAMQQVLVQGQTDTGRWVDLTHQARYQVADGQAVTVSRQGALLARFDGQTSLDVVVAGRTFQVPVTVRESTQYGALNFENQLLPIFNKYGCNASGCHGKAEGQNGFKLSVFGFDPAGDHQALTMQSRGRRVFFGAPEQSLLIRKASGTTPHGGGTLIPQDSPEYRLLKTWISAGVPFGTEKDPVLVGIEVEPTYRQMEMSQSQQLRVTAKWSDGTHRDVTAMATYQTNKESLAIVDRKGRVNTGQVPGTVAIMANYLGAVSVFRAMIPRSEAVVDYPKVLEKNFLDQHVNRQLQDLNIVPSGNCTDADFLRRVYLDVIGSLPTAAEARAFLSDQRPDRRAQLVKQLLERPEYADYWALKWADTLRVERLKLGRKNAYAYYRWIRQSFLKNKPFDRFAREVVTAEGPLNELAAGHFYKSVGSPKDWASTLSQVFLGVRIECAQCHHHPFDRWSQQDYYGMEAFFAQVKFKQTSRGEAIVAEGAAKTTHPRSGKEVFAHPLATKMPAENNTGDRRVELADWMTGAQNPWFAHNVANRMWAHFLGRGLVEPLDDFRLTNPPSNPALLDSLAHHLVENDYNLHALIQLITASAAYQRSVAVNATNREDEDNYSRFLFKRMDAEVLLDAICQVTGVEEKFAGIPEGSRAIQLWDSAVPHYFLKTFGRPVRVTACTCERAVDPTVSQVLHMLNAPGIQEKLSHVGGQVARLVAKHPDPATLIEELYLAMYSRFPTGEERRNGMNYLKNQPNRQLAVEDLCWSMMNSIEFVFNH
jgi:hypothetical protein